jgi:hypothetical protein
VAKKHKSSVESSSFGARDDNAKSAVASLDGLSGAGDALSGGSKVGLRLVASTPASHNHNRI